MTPIDKGVQKITCVSHGCELWLGRHLSKDDIRAIKKVHALQHDNRPITPDSILGNEHGESQ